MRRFCIIPLVFLGACAARSAVKIPWTYDAPPEPPAEGGQGGGLEPESLPPLPLTRMLAPARKAIEPDGNRPAPGKAPRTSTTLTLKWPISATGINSLFGNREDPFDGSRRFHYGVDLAGTYGELVRACAEGVVVHAGWHSGHGRQVVIEHAGGFRTSYSHLSQVLVFEGDTVAGGQLIGRLGNSGRSTGPHLHFEVSRWGQPIDPVDVLGVTQEIY